MDYDLQLVTESEFVTYLFVDLFQLLNLLCCFYLIFIAFMINVIVDLDNH